MNEWIDVNKRLPDDLDDVLFHYVIKNIIRGDIVKSDQVCGHIAKGVWHICYLYISMPLNDRVTVTHWQQLPEPPT